MKKVLLFLLILMVFISCKKTEDDISGTAQIGGKLYIQNTYDTLFKKLVAGTTVFVSKDTNVGSAVFLYSNKSDKDGYFLFNGLYNSVKYALRSEIRSKTLLDTGILFSVEMASTPKNDIALVLEPDLKKQNAVFISCKDELTPVGTIPFVNIYIYTSKALADADVDIAGVGASYMFAAQRNGTAFKMNLPPVKDLYIKGSATFSASIKFKSLPLPAIRLDIKDVLPIDLIMRKQ